MLYITTALSILLPYGIVTTDTVGMTIIQVWLFPLWNYVHDFGNWMGFGVITPPFLPSFPLLPSILGVIWCGLGIYVSKSLHQYKLGQRGKMSVWILILGSLILQIIATIILGFVVWGNYLQWVVPLPIHFLIILFLLLLQTHRVNQSEGEGIIR